MNEKIDLFLDIHIPVENLPASTSFPMSQSSFMEFIHKHARIGCSLTEQTEEPNTEISPTKSITSEWISVSETAKILGISRQAVAKAIKKGRLRAQRVGHLFFVDLHSVRIYQSRKKKG